MKTCFKCHKTKPISCFYKHKMMADGYLGKCKDCTKTDTIVNRLNHLDYYLDYDRKRAQSKERIKARKDYANTKAGKLVRYWAQRRNREKFPDKYKARNIFWRAIRAGTIQKKPCALCGKKAEGHHPDYSKPLEVVWLCKFHHRLEEGRISKYWNQP